MPKSLTILLLGAGLSSNASLSRQLAEAGHKVLSTDMAHRAESLIAEQIINAVFVGQAIKDMNYLDFIAMVSVDHKEIGILVLTYDREEDLSIALAKGAHDYLLLPSSTSLLNWRLNRVVEHLSLLESQQNINEHELLIKLEKEVQIGREIQMSFLPRSLPQPENWEIAACFHPAREVAGDFYDSFYIWNKRRVGFIVADVSDKGIPAALFMAIFRTLLRAGSLYNMSVSGGDSFDPVLTPHKSQADWSITENGRHRKLPTIGISQLGSIASTNAYMAETHGIDAYFVTLFFGILDPRTGDLIYVNGGHNPPVLVRKEGGYELLRPTGPAVGILPEAKFSYAHTKLKPGDTLYAYTDGVPEARDPEGKFFTDERLYKLVSEKKRSAVEVVGLVESQLERFIANAVQFDDITMMALHYKEPEM